jgi:Ribbon-helix-helix protein, copG family
MQRNPQQSITPSIRGRKPTDKPRATCASASLPPDNYAKLQNIARQKKVSVAWVIRDAAEKYIADQWPLLNRGNQENA